MFPITYLYSQLSFPSDEFFFTMGPFTATVGKSNKLQKMTMKIAGTVASDKCCLTSVSSSRKFFFLEILHQL